MFLKLYLSLSQIYIFRMSLVYEVEDLYAYQTYICNLELHQN